MMRGSLAEKLRILRARKGLSLTEAAEQAGITRDTLSELERGKRHPYMPTLHKIAEGYSVPVEELLEAEPAPLVEVPGETGPEQPPLNGFEEEQRENWRSAVDNARRLREGGHARLEGLVAAWQASRERGELRSARRRYKEEIEELFNKSYDARNALTDILFPGGPPPEEDWEEVRAADSFYLSLIEVMRDAGFRIEEGGSQPPKVVDPDAA